jgi:hypothetical protein
MEYIPSTRGWFKFLAGINNLVLPLEIIVKKGILGSNPYQ